MAPRAVYLDHNGTTPVAPDVLEAMLPYFSSNAGNASAATAAGRIARAAVERARHEVAGLIGAADDEIIFTSGGTEASNHAIFGFAAAAGPARRRIVTSGVEHPATEMPCRRLQRSGFEVVRVPVDVTGSIDAAAAATLIDERTALVTFIHAQNETGTLQPVAEIAALAQRMEVPIHIDAAQSVGKVAIDVQTWGIDALTIAGHKLYAPKGIGALYLRRGRAIDSVMAGAGQESGRRPGTENVPSIVGLGRACAIAKDRLIADEQRLAALRDHLWLRLADRIAGIIRVAAGAPTLPNTLNVLFPHVTGNDLLAATPDIEASTGSTCHAGETTPSSILLALGYAPEIAVGAVRLTLGRDSTAGDVQRAADALAASWLRLTRRAAR